jgi:hypothetical protein
VRLSTFSWRPVFISPCHLTLFSAQHPLIQHRHRQRSLQFIPFSRFLLASYSILLVTTRLFISNARPGLPTLANPCPERSVSCPLCVVCLGIPGVVLDLSPQLLECELLPSWSWPRCSSRHLFTRFIQELRKAALSYLSHEYLTPTSRLPYHRFLTSIEAFSFAHCHYLFSISQFIFPSNPWPRCTQSFSYFTLQSVKNIPTTAFLYLAARTAVPFNTSFSTPTIS